MVILFDEKAFVVELNRQNESEFLKRIEQYDRQMSLILRANGYKRVDASERTVLFTFGEITFCRNRWRKGNKTRYPVDEWLGLKKYTKYSPELMLHMAKHASKLPYREVCRVMKDAYNLHITKDAVLKAVKVVERLFSEKEKFRFLLDECPKEKIQTNKIYIEGDGVMVKTTSKSNYRYNTDLAHFLVHTGPKKSMGKRITLANKYEIIHTSHEKAMEELLDYLYNHFEITENTILITNSDNGKGYTRRTFQEIKKALGIKHHEHFWDENHLNEKINDFFKPYPEVLRDLAYKAILNHQKPLFMTVLDSVESLIQTDEEFELFYKFKQKMIRNFKDTKAAKLRGLSQQCIGVMESQHCKVTYRMKHRGMYWSLKGAYAMAKMILVERIDQLEELFFGDWRKQYQYYQGISLSAGYSNRRINPSSQMRTYKSGHKNGRWRTHAK
ncbi:ISLre2 family transposase [Streptococcus sp. FSL R7-0212]|uniref:ISLre2 family transposase n=1 Tax=Streptococcus sp. FSL R7-0212 TaxID=2921726 RepID=UPI0030F8B5DB